MINQPYYKTASANPSQVIPTEPRGCWGFLFGFASLVAIVASILGFCGSVGTLSFMTKPFDFGFEIAFVLLTLCMASLDVPQIQHKEWIKNIKHICYTHAYVLSTFTGRGLAYMVLGTWSFLALWDEAGNIIQMAAGAGCTVLLLLIGWLAYRKGSILTRRLEKVRESMLRRGESSDNYFRRGVDDERLPLTKEQWRALFEQHDARPHVDMEMDFLMAAISTKPFNNVELDQAEFDEWLNAPSTVPFWV